MPVADFKDKEEMLCFALSENERLRIQVVSRFECTSLQNARAIHPHSVFLPRCTRCTGCTGRNQNFCQRISLHLKSGGLSFVTFFIGTLGTVGTPKREDATRNGQSSSAPIRNGQSSSAPIRNGQSFRAPVTVRGSPRGLPRTVTLLRRFLVHGSAIVVLPVSTSHDPRHGV